MPGPLTTSSAVGDFPAGVAKSTDVTTHAGLATGVHGVGAGTIAKTADISSAVSTHAGLATGVHGAGAGTLAKLPAALTELPAAASVTAQDIAALLVAYGFATQAT